MIGLLIISHENLGEEFVRCATHILGERPKNLSCLAVQPNDDPDLTITQAKALLADLDQGEGVIIITDICGATPCNIASQLTPNWESRLFGWNQFSDAIKDIELSP